MRCPKCDGDTQVLETRQTRRRRQCLVCGHRFSTFEVLSDNLPEYVTQRDKKPKAAPVRKSLGDMKVRAKARAEARRKIEEKRDKARWQKDDWFSSDNDYLPEV